MEDQKWLQRCAGGIQQRPWDSMTGFYAKALRVQEEQSRLDEPCSSH